jgi:hypothetical protein
MFFLLRLNRLYDFTVTLRYTGKPKRGIAARAGYHALPFTRGNAQKTASRC